MKLDELYKLPWTNTDNPNGWVEPTSYCQLKCPGCYRGLDQPGRPRKHLALEEVQRQVDALLEKRNIQTLSIAGGEPLMYPQLDELVSYAARRGACTRVFTNGVMLTEDRLARLKRAGATEVIIHIDRLQERDGVTNEVEGNALRERFCQMFRALGGVNLAFIMPVSSRTAGDLALLVPFFQKNSDVITAVVFTVLAEFKPVKTLEEDLSLNMDGLADLVATAFGLQFNAFLGSERSSHVGWLLSQSLYNEGRFLGSFDAEISRRIQARARDLTGKFHITIPSQQPLTFNQLYPWSDNPSVRRIYERYSKLHPGSDQLHQQSVFLIKTPVLVGDEWDLCDGCPDAMLHEGHLVPSCLLERIQAGEPIASLRPRPAPLTP